MGSKRLKKEPLNVAEASDIVNKCGAWALLQAETGARVLRRGDDQGDVQRRGTMRGWTWPEWTLEDFAPEAHQPPAENL